MQSEKLMLSWQEHHGALVSVFEALLQSNTLVDCTLAAEGQCLKAHKVVLCACSPYFQLMFKEASEKHPIVFLKDVKFKEVKAIVDFMYRGEVEVSEDRLGRFLEVANSLQVKGLNSSRNTHTLEERISRVSGEARPNDTVTTASFVPSKHLQKNHLLSNEHNVGISAKTEGDRTKDRDDEYTSHQQSSHANIASASKTVSIESSFSVASSSFPVVSENPDKQSAPRKGSPPASFPGVEEKLPSGVQTIKTEPENDSYHDQHSVFVNERGSEDFEEETSMMEDTNDWIESRPESIHDQQYSNFPSAHVKTENHVSDAGVEEQTMEHPSSQEATSFEDAGPFTSHASNEAWPLQWPQPRADSAPDFPAPSAARKDSPAPPAYYSSLKKHLCAVCHKAFATPSHLNTHMRTHTGVRPFECRECKTTFTQSNNLKRHLRVHAREQPYKCSVCQCAFRDSSHLQRHALLHTGERPYGCDICGCSFARSDMLRDHQRLHTGE